MLARWLGRGAGATAAFVTPPHDAGVAALATARLALPAASADLAVYVWTGSASPRTPSSCTSGLRASSALRCSPRRLPRPHGGGLLAGLTRLADAVGIPAAWMVAAALLVASGLCYTRIRPPVGVGVGVAGRMGDPRSVRNPRVARAGSEADWRER